MLKLPKKEISAQEEQSKGRLKIIIGIGVIAILLTYYVTLPNTQTVTSPSAPPPVKQQVRQLAVEKSQPIMPSGYQSEKVTRNPFALPADIIVKNDKTAPQSTASAGNQLHNQQTINLETKPAKKNMPDLRLSGLIISQDMQLAVIQADGKSKSYQINDSVGGYQIVDIDQDSVVLSGPDGQKVLNLESIHKGGGKNEK